MGEVVPPILTAEQVETWLLDGCVDGAVDGDGAIAASHEALRAERDFYASDCTALLKAEAELVVVRQALTAIVSHYGIESVSAIPGVDRAVLAGTQ